MEKYGFDDKQDFKFIKIGKGLHSLVLKYEEGIFRNKSFVLIRDTINSNLFSLNQIGLHARDFRISKENFDTLLNETNSIVNQFKNKYGEPTKIVDRKERYFGQNDKDIADDIIAVTWDTNNVKLKITFSKAGEKGPYWYQLRISKFQDYYGNMKLPESWNGY